MVSCLKVRIYFPIREKSLVFSPWELENPGKGLVQAANIGKNVGPGHLPVFCRCPEICC